MPTASTRRGLLATVCGASAVALAGCLDADPATTTTATTAGTDEPSTGTDGSAPADGADLDLREANVTAVAVDCSDGECRFDVTLYHDDDGEDGYANWWQVETPNGERLGRRDLRHAHGTREFTRSATVVVPDGVTEVVVRGHDQTHGYGGQAMVVDLTTGETRAVQKGSEPDSVAD